ncbi:MAG TPA: hypothetical protein VJT74_13195 [Pyrinomonadaceae bacterium]|nr:hypothetical protein [Pyrinomonadaceae bacterium]
MLLRKLVVLFVLGVAALLSAATKTAAAPTPISVYGAWHCGNDACTWASPRDMMDFDLKNRWLINRGDGRPSVNLVVLSFVQPLKLLNKTTDAQTLNGVPRGMDANVVNYFKSRGVRVQLSIGGITYVDAWNQALAQNATQLGLNAADVARNLGVGIEIDYEENTNPNLAGLQAFINAYRSQLPYDSTGNSHAARLTIDLAAGDRWLIALTRKATADWLNTTTPVLDYANAMVPSKQPTNASTAQADWQEHIDGKAQYNPPIPPLAAAKFTGSLYIVTGQNPAPECVNFNNSLQKSTGNYVQTVVTKTGVTNGMLGYMFWAAECPSTRRICTVPPNSCEGGVGGGATTYNVPIPMPGLRQN